jgi:hypothetical protein
VLACAGFLNDVDAFLGVLFTVTTSAEITRRAAEIATFGSIEGNFWGIGVMAVDALGQVAEPISGHALR